MRNILHKMWSKLRTTNIRWDQNFLKLLFEYLILSLEDLLFFSECNKKFTQAMDQNYDIFVQHLQAPCT